MKKLKEEEQHSDLQTEAEDENNTSKRRRKYVFCSVEIEIVISLNALTCTRMKFPLKFELCSKTVKKYSASLSRAGTSTCRTSVGSVI